MCTLILGLGVAGPETLLVGANRDESPGRPSAGPALLRGRPSVVGGRDLLAGGTWLAVREGRFVAALLNRRPPAEPARAAGETGATEAAGQSFRSRGILCLEAAALGPPFDAPAAIDPATGDPYPARLDAALRLAGRARYAPCSLVGLEPGGPSWVVTIGPGAEPRGAVLEPGWHVITHAEMDDPGEPRASALLERLRGQARCGVKEGLELIRGLLGGHGEGGSPPVCLHRERFPTVSSTLLALGPEIVPRYEHAAGPPCVTPYEDFARLLA